jgi:hypothetical protein
MWCDDERKAPASYCTPRRASPAKNHPQNAADVAKDIAQNERQQTRDMTFNEAVYRDPAFEKYAIVNNVAVEVDVAPPVLGVDGDLVEELNADLLQSHKFLDS